MSGMEKLLARIKALFAPGPAAAPPAEVDVTATPVAAPYEAAKARSSEPIVTIDEPPLVEEAPVVTQETPVLAEEATTPIEAADLLCAWLTRAASRCRRSRTGRRPW